jgi:hypothetical protein
MSERIAIVGARRLVVAGSRDLTSDDYPIVDRYTFFGWAIRCETIQALRWPDALAQYATQYVKGEGPENKVESGGGAETRSQGRPPLALRFKGKRGSVAEWVADAMLEKTRGSATNGERITHVLREEAGRVLAGGDPMELARMVLELFG